MALSSLPSAIEHTAAPAPPRHVMGMEDLAPDLGALIDSALELKARHQQGRALPALLDGKAFVVVFEKNSTRTRVSFDLGIQRLGGCNTILESQTSQLGRGETIEDTAKVLSGYADAVVYRAKDHAALAAMARHATVPVVNALTDLEHPCQVLADLATLVEHVRSTQIVTNPAMAKDPAAVPELAGLTLAYVGDGNNMCHSYLIGGALAGMNVRVATPPGYGPDPDVVERAEDIAASRGARIDVGHHATEAVDGAHAVCTDTWISMGDEEEAKQRLADFDGYTVDDALMDHAAPNAVFLHCLPGHWGHEATYEVAHGPRSLILPEAENRMWTQMALLDALVNPSHPRQMRLAAVEG